MSDISTPAQQWYSRQPIGDCNKTLPLGKPSAPFNFGLPIRCKSFQRIMLDNLLCYTLLCKYQVTSNFLSSKSKSGKELCKKRSALSDVGFETWAAQMAFAKPLNLATLNLHLLKNTFSIIHLLIYYYLPQPFCHWEFQPFNHFFKSLIFLIWFQRNAIWQILDNMISISK